MTDYDNTLKYKLHDLDRPLTNGDKGVHRISPYLCKQKTIHQKTTK